MLHVAKINPHHDIQKIKIRSASVKNAKACGFRFNVDLHPRFD